MDHGVLELAAHPLDLPDVHVLDRVAQVVHPQGAARVVADLDLPERGEELLLVLDVAVDGLQGLVVEARPRVALRGVERRRAVVALLVGRGELLVGRAVQGRAVDERGDDAHRLVTHGLQDVLVGQGPDADERDSPLEPGVAPRLHEAR